MTVEPGTGGLIVLAADRDIEETLTELFARPEALGVVPFEYEIRRHPRRDPGCRIDAAEFLRPFSHRFDHALVVFDRHGCGDSGPRENIETGVEQGLRLSGWEGRGRVVVIDPELETWIWSESPAVLAALALDTKGIKRSAPGWPPRNSGTPGRPSRTIRRRPCSGACEKRGEGARLESSVRSPLAPPSRDAATPRFAESGPCYRSGIPRVANRRPFSRLSDPRRRRAPPPSPGRCWRSPRRVSAGSFRSRLREARDAFLGGVPSPPATVLHPARRRHTAAS